jgi:hypothetical protein
MVCVCVTYGNRKVNENDKFEGQEFYHWIDSCQTGFELHEKHVRFQSR